MSEVPARMGTTERILTPFLGTAGPVCFLSTIYELDIWYNSAFPQARFLHGSRD